MTKQEIRFCTAPDGTHLAYARVGQGAPLVKVGTWLSHIEYDWESPVWQPWLEKWTRTHAYYRYDPRGCGLSDRDVTDFSLDALVSDLETVVNAADLARFDLFAMSQASSVSIAYTARHPERVKRLIVLGGYVRGMSDNPTPEELEATEINLKLLWVGWGNKNPAFRQVFTTRLIPEGTPEQYAWLNNLQLVSTSAENAVALAQTFNQMDVRELAKQVRTPTLILHTSEDAAVPFELGRETAALIPGARLVVLEGKNHVLMPTEPAWPLFWREVYQFLGVQTAPSLLGSPGSPSRSDKVLLELTLREREVLRLLAAGYLNGEIASKLVLSEKTIRNYTSSIYAKLQVRSRREAIIWAREAGLLGEKTSQM